MLAPSEVSSSLLVLWNRNKWLVEVEGDSVGVNLIRRMFLWLDVTPHHLHCSPRPSLLSPSDSLWVSVCVCFYANMWKWNGYKFLQHLRSQSTFWSESFTGFKQMSKKLLKKDVLLRLSISDPVSHLWRDTCGWMSAHSSVLQHHRTKCVGLVRFSPVLQESAPVAHGPALGHCQRLE